MHSTLTTEGADGEQGLSHAVGYATEDAELCQSSESRESDQRLASVDAIAIPTERRELVIGAQPVETTLTAGAAVRHNSGDKRIDCLQGFH